jgi:hypothetical protein
MDDQPPLAQQIKALTHRLKGINAFHAEIVDATRSLQSLVLFETHPELAELDATLNNLYPGDGQ